MIKKVFVKKVQQSGKEISQKQDVVAIEEPLEINLKSNGGKIFPVSVTMRTPGNDEELAVGFLHTEAILFSRKNIEQEIPSNLGFNWITINLSENFDPNIEKLKRNFYTSSSCGVCGKESIEAIHQTRRIPAEIVDIEVNLETLFSLPEELYKVQKTFQSTGGIHAAAFFSTDGKLISYREDVGRHNALDKLIGAEFLKSSKEAFFLQENILLLSGRASFELLQKAAMAGIQMVCAIGAPSSLAIETAENFGITLIGFLKNGSFNIYTNAERVKNLG
ncbi:formate dehydrogenase accessory sulfurtransferase FdhD [Frigoriflavimonas asaccharolytica]|uniref:Sulfur carrier protein FdhD n=1 Tax=Frigoriflavimonas asaccharolytica TaxID=2735899 RepID=A0A8J8K7W8_9FLAO|nr:formate dehydrogenase accessory sulfurtransferase FdhD [Frigoriflavimonas asaccharolytica]NRS91951.1 FdhD protein [Frigoriflavimonas asaccharolytica]